MNPHPNALTCTHACAQAVADARGPGIQLSRTGAAQATGWTGSLPPRLLMRIALIALGLALLAAGLGIRSALE